MNLKLLFLFGFISFNSLITSFEISECKIDFEEKCKVKGSVGFNSERVKEKNRFEFDCCKDSLITWLEGIEANKTKSDLDIKRECYLKARKINPILFAIERNFDIKEFKSCLSKN
jgi:hypothetical protein